MSFYARSKSEWRVKSYFCEKYKICVLSRLTFRLGPLYKSESSFKTVITLITIPTLPVPRFANTSSNSV